MITYTMVQRVLLIGALAAMLSVALSLILLQLQVAVILHGVLSWSSFTGFGVFFGSVGILWVLQTFERQYGPEMAARLVRIPFPIWQRVVLTTGCLIHLFGLLVATWKIRPSSDIAQDGATALVYLCGIAWIASILFCMVFRLGTEKIAHRKLSAGTCPGCGYSLRGLLHEGLRGESDSVNIDCQCPECGKSWVVNTSSWSNGE